MKNRKLLYFLLAALITLSWMPFAMLDRIFFTGTIFYRNTVLQVGKEPALYAFFVFLLIFWVIVPLILKRKFWDCL